MPSPSWQVLDKGCTLEAAGAVGIDVPKSASSGHLGRRGAVAASSLPAVLKRSDLNLARGAGAPMRRASSW